MGRLVEFELEDGGSVLIEVQEHGEPVRLGGTTAPGVQTPGAPGAGAPESGAPTTRGLSSRVIPEQARRSFEEGVDRVMPAVANVIGRLRALADQPDEVRVEFGLDLHAEAGAFVASASAGANFSVSMTWRRDGAGGSHGQRPGG